MPNFSVTVRGQFPADVTPQNLETFLEAIRRHALGAVYVRDPQLGRFEAVLPLGADSQNQAESLGRLIVISGLFDCGFTCRNSSVEEVDSRPV